MLPSYPLVSVIMPVFNGGKFLGESVGSIREQNYDPLEIIIVDDGSTDNTAELVSQLGSGIRYIYQHNLGPASARNAGLKIAQGNLIAFLDVDDLWPVGKLYVQVDFLGDHPDQQVVLGKTRLFGDLHRLKNNPEFDKRSYTILQIFLGSCVCRKPIFNQVGFFEETLRYGEDLDWFLRAREMKIPIAFIDQVSLHYRVHAGNMMRVSDLRDLQFPKLLKKSLDRRRSRNGASFHPLPNFLQEINRFDNNNGEKRS